jgi:hypothetical protein
MESFWSTFFISHGSDNKIRALHRREALERLFPVTSILWYDREIMTSILIIFEDLVKQIPFYELSFTPSEDVVEELENFSSQNMGSIVSTLRGYDQ